MSIVKQGHSHHPGDSGTRKVETGLSSMNLPSLVPDWMGDIVGRISSHFNRKVRGAAY